ncbi:hypothetical protein ET005_06165 [Lactococcus petauri]|nr:hypothetical protein [Lactococcus petauri]
MLLDVMFLLTIIFILLCLLGIVTSYVWAKRQNRIYPKTWVRLIREKNKNIDITEVEDRAGIDLADKLKIDNRQGYFIDKPHYEK